MCKEFEEEIFCSVRTLSSNVSEYYRSYSLNKSQNETAILVISQKNFIQSLQTLHDAAIECSTSNSSEATNDLSSCAMKVVCISVHHYCRHILASNHISDSKLEMHPDIRQSSMEALIANSSVIEELRSEENEELKKQNKEDRASFANVDRNKDAIINDLK